MHTNVYNINTVFIFREGGKGGGREGGKVGGEKGEIGVGGEEEKEEMEREEK